MSITVRRFNSSDEMAWDEFVESSNNGTLFHTRKFLNYHPEDRFIDHDLIFEKKTHIISVLPATIQKKDGEQILISHPGASVGSCVISEKLSFAESLEIVESLSNYAQANKIDRIRLIQPPIIYHRHLSHYMDFAFKNGGYSYVHRELSSYLHLENTIEDNLSKFKPTHRTALRKAEKLGVKVRLSDDFETFYPILQNNLSIRHNVSPTHTLLELLRLKKLSPDKIHLFGAYMGNEMIAGVVNFIVNPKVVLVFYISHKQGYTDHRSLNLLIYEIIKWSLRKQLKILDFGIFTVNETPNMGLARFKENFGAIGIFRDTIELNLSKCQ